MIKQKFLKVLMWIRDNFRFLVEVVVRLSVGIENKEDHNQDESGEADSEKGDYYDK